MKEALSECQYPRGLTKAFKRVITLPFSLVDPGLEHCALSSPEQPKHNVQNTNRQRGTPDMASPIRVHVKPVRLEQARRSV